MRSIIRTLCKRPIITVFITYVFALILLDTFGYFSYEKQSYLYKLIDNNATVSIEGRILSVPQLLKDGKRFVIKTNIINGRAVSEKIIVNSPSGYSVTYGDIINVEGKLKKPFSSAFPLLFDYQKYLARSGIYVVLDISSLEYIDSKPNIIKKFAFAFRQDIIKKFDDYFKRPYSDVLKSLIIGDKSTLSRDIKNSFSDSGIMHILVVSGLHVGFISIIVLFILKLTGLSLKKVSLLSIPFIFFYCFATGANPPALRSAIMFSCVIFSLSLGREPLIYNSLALSALIILIFQPQQLFTASFQMSYSATIGVVCFYKNVLGLFRNVKGKILRFFCGVLSVTISAQLILIPVCMHYFGKISIISFVTNIIVTPLTGIILYLGIIFYILTFIFHNAAALCSFILSLLLKFVLSVTIFLGNIKFAVVLIPKPSVIQLLLFFLFMFCIGYFENKKKFIFSGIILISSFLYFIFPAVHEKNKVFFNVYKGNSITALQIKNNSANAFILYNKSKYYDRYYIDSFKQFMAFSGIKKADITAVGFDEEKIYSDLINFNISTIEPAGAKTLDFHLNDYLIRVDTSAKKLYIDDIEFSFKDKTSFYYNKKKKVFK
ncbi:ComEC/Rec2 family competence protein [Candidatus Endomicrobiellum trichonymphae]|uniref:ComEC-like cytoplasmic membrane protein n=1 Tax=Endomicrobium trichonymphae TaxID=1408204 RepID=B1H0F1_ENDTX|nr:ComEC/Rec2 family competence protein [Candidatus Endomicrobium trichonymphae]BAG13983.1 ComEC-like cytoplasmic membrane protein [Candidatus Endomicrobium trichonymphae]